MNRKNSIYGRDFIRNKGTYHTPGGPLSHHTTGYIKPTVYETSTAKSQLSD